MVPCVVFTSTLLLLAFGSRGLGAFDLKDPDTQHITPLNANLTQQVLNEQAESTRLQTQVTGLVSQLSNLNNAVGTLQTAVDSYQPIPTHMGPTGDALAFEATLGSDSNNMEHGHIMAFRTVVFNVGGAYDSTHGVFNCAKKGIYLFAVTLVSHGERAPAAVELTLSSGGATKVIARPYTGTGDDLVSTGEVAIVEANAGDHVTLRYAGEAVALVDEHSRFSGVLVHEIP